MFSLPLLGPAGQGQGDEQAPVTRTWTITSVHDDNGLLEITVQAKVRLPLPAVYYTESSVFSCMISEFFLSRLRFTSKESPVHSRGFSQDLQSALELFPTYTRGISKRATRMFELVR